MGPIEVNINDSVEPMERNVRATIPELEAEMIMMVRPPTRASLKHLNKVLITWFKC